MRAQPGAATGQVVGVELDHRDLPTGVAQQMRGQQAAKRAADDQGMSSGHALQHGPGHGVIYRCRIYRNNLHVTPSIPCSNPCQALGWPFHALFRFPRLAMPPAYALALRGQSLIVLDIPPMWLSGAPAG